MGHEARHHTFKRAVRVAVARRPLSAVILNCRAIPRRGQSGPKCPNHHSARYLEGGRGTRSLVWEAAAPGSPWSLIRGGAENSPRSASRSGIVSRRGRLPLSPLTRSLIPRARSRIPCTCEPFDIIIPSSSWKPDFAVTSPMSCRGGREGWTRGGEKDFTTQGEKKQEGGGEGPHALQGGERRAGRRGAKDVHLSWAR